MVAQFRLCSLGRWRVASVAVFLSVFFTANTALAKGVSVLALPTQDSPASSERLQSLLSILLRKEKKVLVDALTKARGVAQANLQIPAKDTTREIQRGLDSAWQAYLEGRGSFAIRQLHKLRDTIVESPNRESRRWIAEVSIRLGVALVDLGRNAEASDEFRFAHALYPDRIVSDSEFKPEVVSAYTIAIAADVGVQKKRVAASPAMAKVVVDGQILSSTAIALSDGLHLIEASLPGYYSYAELVSVGLGNTAKIFVELQANPDEQHVLAGAVGLALGTSELAARQTLTSILRYSKVEEMVFVASVWRGGQAAVVGQLCSGLPATCSGVVEIRYAEGGLKLALRELLTSLRLRKKMYPPTILVDSRLLAAEAKPRKPETSARPLWKNRWIWASAAAIGVVGGAVYLLRQEDQYRPVFSGETCDFGGCE